MLGRVVDGLGVPMFSAFSQSTQSESVPKEPPKELSSNGYTKVTKLL
ncbi:hypothetical protein MTR67_011583 [Solanum verrucosum]|uniref:Uncharacterized protein n=1 Tax=Solanum verrucosum TaxID=315347 RepID=A0AAF0Q8P0_SOLVR|nr:hypothetical protein MTR67_011583 [Solanum verrucosum]